MSASRLALVAVLLGVLAASVAPMRGAAQEGRQGSMQQGPTANVAAENRASTGVHVYAIQEGHMVPLGFLEAGATETLTIPSVFIESGEPVRLVADPLASTDWYRSDPVTIGAQDEVDFTIESDLERSTVSVGD